MARRQEILVSWVSTWHYAEPLLTVLAHPDSELAGRVDLVVLCHREAPGGPTEPEAVATTLAQLAALPPGTRPRVATRPWRTATPPTDHAAVLAFAKEVLEGLRAEHPSARLNVHLSSGTKAMHAAWLILAHGGFVEGPLRLLQTHDPRHHEDGRAPLEWVELPSEAWAHILRTTAPRAVPDDDLRTLWDPARVKSAAARETLAAVARWAPLPAPLLLIGERGTGKTTLAHAIRARSRFHRLAATEWPVVVCGQFRTNPELARAELFGHAKHAFTGALSARPGLLERVDGDTLFLDEVGDLDRGTQRLLMAAVEGRGFHRLGEVSPRTSSFRLVAATNRPLAELARAGGGRDDDALDADFFDRISTFVLRIPPLRERREDLPALWASALGEVAARAGLAPAVARPLATDRALLDAFARHALPGNLRDLQRAAWYATAALLARESPSRARKAALEALDTAPPGGVAASPPPVASPPPAPAPAPNALSPPAGPTLPLDLDAHLEAEERRLVAHALAAAAGNKTRAAELLGLKRETFTSRLKRLDGTAPGAPAPPRR